MDTAFRGFWSALWICCGLGLLFIAPTVWASGTVPLPGGQVTCAGSTGSSPEQACHLKIAALMQADRDADPRVTVAETSFACSTTSSQCAGAWTITYPWGEVVPKSASPFWTQGSGSCPANSTPGPGASLCTCTDPTISNGSSCVIQSECSKTAAPDTTYLTVGWSVRDLSSEVAPNVSMVQGGNAGLKYPDPGSDTCVKGCKRTVQQSTGEWWSGTTPSANGLYRIAIAYVTTGKDEACQIANEDAGSPGQPAPACQGFTGLVNGKPACIPNVPFVSASAPTIPGQGRQGNPAAGESGAKPIGDPSVTPSTGAGTASGGPPAQGDGRFIPGGSIGSGGGSAGGGGSGSGGSGGGGTGAIGGGKGSTGSNGTNTEGGTCQLNPSAAGCGGSVAAQPDLYTKKAATFETALGDFKTQVQGSALGTATGGFLTVQGGGTCPSFSAHIPYINAEVTIDQFCSEFATGALALLKLAVMVVAGIAAFRVAVL